MVFGLSVGPRLMVSVYCHTSLTTEMLMFGTTSVGICRIMSRAHDQR